MERGWARALLSPLLQSFFLLSGCPFRHLFHFNPEFYVVLGLTEFQLPIWFDVVNKSLYLCVFIFKILQGPLFLFNLYS